MQTGKMKTKNKNNVTKVEAPAGCDVAEAVRMLLAYKKDNLSVYCEFNGHKLYSDTVTMDSAYKKVCGCTKAELDERQRKWMDDYAKQQNEHNEKIPELTEYWIKRGMEILSEDKWELWKEIVPIRLKDLYQGSELKWCLDITKALNEGMSTEDALKLFYEQGHSGMSCSLTRAMIREFCDKGQSFASLIH